MWLSDLTVDQHVGEQAEVLGTIPGASEDGAYVYFVANGVLAPGAAARRLPTHHTRTGASAAPNATCTSPSPIPKIPAQRQTAADRAAVL